MPATSRPRPPAETKDAVLRDVATAHNHDAKERGKLILESWVSDALSKCNFHGEAIVTVKIYGGRIVNIDATLKQSMDMRPTPVPTPATGTS